MLARSQTSGVEFFWSQGISRYTKTSTEIHPPFENYEFIGFPTGPALVFVLGPNRE
jgi:hypothetical protein